MDKERKKDFLKFGGLKESLPFASEKRILELTKIFGSIKINSISGHNIKVEKWKKFDIWQGFTDYSF